MKRVLIACECSGVVREAFKKIGWDAWSCDLLPTEIPGNHYQMNVRDIPKQEWDLMIAHPPCTYLSVSGIHWNGRGRGWNDTYDAIDFVKYLMARPIPRICIENPISVISSIIRKPDQIIQPHQFGHDASKATCLWLTGLPKLMPTVLTPPRMVGLKKRWANQTDSGQNKLGPSATRAKGGPKTYQGIADAMADQWSNL